MGNIVSDQMMKDSGHGNIMQKILTPSSVRRRRFKYVSVDTPNELEIFQNWSQEESSQRTTQFKTPAQEAIERKILSMIKKSLKNTRNRIDYIIPIKFASSPLPNSQEPRSPPPVEENASQKHDPSSLEIKAKRLDSLPLSSYVRTFKTRRVKDDVVKRAKSDFRSISLSSIKQELCSPLKQNSKSTTFTNSSSSSLIKLIRKSSEEFRSGSIRKFKSPRHIGKENILVIEDDNCQILNDSIKNDHKNISDQ